MKQLFINNKKIILGEETYFPFSHKINDLENIEIIGAPKSKTISIPRNPNNDEIFGHIAEINRMIIDDEDNKIGVSFNQIRKVNYEYYDDSELRSEGIIRIKSITNTSYEVELYDKIIELLESLDGNTETGEGFLNSLDIIKNNNQPFSLQLYAENIKNLNISGDTSVVPTFNIKEYGSTGTDAYVNYVPSTGSTYFTTQTLPVEMTPIQFGALKPQDVDYSIKLRSVFKSINAEYDDVIDVDTELDDILDEVYLKSVLKSVEYQSTEFSLPSFSINTVYFNYINNNVTNDNQYFKMDIPELKKNGNYRVEVDLYSEFTPNIPYGTDISFWNNTNFSTSTPVGTKVGELFIKVFLGMTVYSPTLVEMVANSPAVNCKIDLILGSNFTYELKNGNVSKLKLSQRLTVPIDFYPIVNDIPNAKPTLYFDFGDLIELSVPTQGFYYNEGNTKLYWYTYLNTGSTRHAGQVNCYFTPTYTNVTYKADKELHSGDIISGKNLLPKITIKEFLINFVKLFNLDIRWGGGKIKISKKKYIYKPEVPLLDIQNIIPTNFDFTKLKMSTKTPDDQIYKDYETQTKRKWCEKLITTNYNIKRNVKNIDFDIAIPGILIDYNSYAYSYFTNYLNGGYSIDKFGDMRGIEDDLVFGYINTSKTFIWVNNDTFYESGMQSVYDNRIPEGKSFILTNESLSYYESTDVYKYGAETSHSKKLDTFKLLTPLKLDGVGNVLKSLEMNKSIYNFADFNDLTYPESTTLYNRYWKSLISDIYNANNHILETKMYLNGIVEPYSIYNYRNNFYTFSEVTEYDPGKSGMYDVKLLKIYNVNNYLGVTNLPQSTIIYWDYNGLTTNIYCNLFYDDTSSPVDECGIVYSTTNWNPTISDNVIQTTPVLGSYTINLIVNEGINYYVRSYAKNSKGIDYSEAISVKVTSAMLLPTVLTLNPSNITQTDVTFNGNVTSQGNAPILSRGFCWSSSNTIPNIEQDDYQTVSGTTGLYSLLKEDYFTPETIYYCRAYARNKYGVSYGEVKVFTLVVKEYGFYIRVMNQSSYTIPSFDITLNTDHWGSPISYNFYGISSGETYIQETSDISSTYTVSFGATMERNNTMLEGWNIDDINFAIMEMIDLYGVSQLDLYTYEAYGEFYIINDLDSNNVYLDFWVLDQVDAAPTVSIQNPSNVGYSVTLNGTLEDLGSNEVTESGFVISTVHTVPTISDTKINIGKTTIGTFNYTFNVSDNVTYYIRSYAINSIGTSYSSSVKTVMVNAAMLKPTVVTNSVNNITINDARFNGNVTSQGQSVITERGFYWGLNNPPTTKVTVSGTTGVYYKDMVDTFTIGNTYYVRAFATNQYGTSYGSIVSFSPINPDYTIVLRVNNYSSTYDVYDVECNVSGAGWTENYNFSIPHWTGIPGEGYAEVELLHTVKAGDTWGFSGELSTYDQSTFTFERGNDDMSFAWLQTFYGDQVYTLDNFPMYDDWFCTGEVNITDDAGATTIYLNISIMEK